MEVSQSRWLVSALPESMHGIAKGSFTGERGPVGCNGWPCNHRDSGVLENRAAR